MIIDFRGRPPTPEFKQYFKYPRVLWSFKRYVGTDQLPRSYMEGSVDIYVEEMLEAGIDMTVATGRNVPECIIPNEHIAGLQEKYPDHIIGFAGIDPSNTVHDAVSEVRRSIEVLGLKGVNMDPGRSAIPMHYNDRRIWPVYEAIQELGVPLIVMGAVWSGPDVTYSNVTNLDEVCGAFPNLRIIPGHGAWPYVLEHIAVCIRRTNLYMAPDGYAYVPGGEYYAQAASQFLDDQLLFATAYPYRPFKWSMEKFAQLPLTPQAREKALHINGVKLMGDLLNKK